MTGSIVGKAPLGTWAIAAQQQIFWSWKFYIDMKWAPISSQPSPSQAVEWIPRSWRWKLSLKLVENLTWWTIWTLPVSKCFWLLASMMALWTPFFNRLAPRSNSEKDKSAQRFLAENFDGPLKRLGSHVIQNFSYEQHWTYRTCDLLWIVRSHKDIFKVNAAEFSSKAGNHMRNHNMKNQHIRNCNMKSQNRNWTIIIRGMKK
jgi:hypothetical protein